LYVSSKDPVFNELVGYQTASLYFKLLGWFVRMVLDFAISGCPFGPSAAQLDRFQLSEMALAPLFSKL
jgi:hypothetical protein